MKMYKILPLILIIIAYTLCQPTPPSQSSQQSQLSSITSPPNVKPTYQQITKQYYFQLESLVDRYVIAVTINQHQQLFGIVGLGQQPSWIFIDQGATNHQLCFQSLKESQLQYMATYQQQIIDNDYVKPQQEKQNSCLQITAIKCMGICKKIKQISLSEQSSILQSSSLYQINIKTKNRQYSKIFLSAERFNVQQIKDLNSGSQQSQFIQVDNLYLNNQKIVDFYATIVGEINIGDFQYSVISHHKEKQSQYYINSLTDFKKFQNQEIILLPNKQGNNKNKIKTKIAGKQLQQASVQFVPRFNSTTSTLGLPHFIYDQLKKYVTETIFEKKCEQLISTIFLCPFNKNKQLQKQTLQFCLSDSNQCFQVSLFDLIMTWQDDIEDQTQKSNTKKQYEYFLKIQRLESNDTIFMYPEFTAIYKILLKSGVTYGLVSHKTKQINHQKQLQNAMKNLKNQVNADPTKLLQPLPTNPNTENHDHHEHVDQQQKKNLGKYQVLQIIKYVSNQTVSVKSIFIFLVVSCLIAIGCMYLRNYMNEQKRLQINGKEWQQGSLIEDQTNRSRKKIFKNMSEPQQQFRDKSAQNNSQQDIQTRIQQQLQKGHALQKQGQSTSLQ